MMMINAGGLQPTQFISFKGKASDFMLLMKQSRELIDSHPEIKLSVIQTPESVGCVNLVEARRQRHKFNRV